MKKQIFASHKLRLDRETLRRLQALPREELAQVQGGIASANCSMAGPCPQPQ